MKKLRNVCVYVFNIKGEPVYLLMPGGKGRGPDNLLALNIDYEPATVSWGPKALFCVSLREVWYYGFHIQLGKIRLRLISSKLYRSYVVE